MKFLVASFLVCLFGGAVHAQDSLGIANSFTNGSPAGLLNIVPAKQWTLNSYKGISTSFIGWRGGSAMAVSAPFGIQLNRRLNNNLSAFAGVSVAPTYLSFNRAFISTDFNKTGLSNSFSQKNNFGLYQRAELGLSYTNDERTFRISGSIGIERSSNNYFIPFSGQQNRNNNSLSPGDRYLY